MYPTETKATFRCRLDSGAVFDWLINGSSRRNFVDLNPLFGVTTDNGTIIDTLTITVMPEHNGTQVACVATVNGTMVISPNATLTIIIGTLDPIHSINKK